ncbi:MAG: GAF domain-containing protein [Flavobacteriaceae bacterium]|nr:GAF domain-containing protein [Flavobacteriaceae bacterium]
MDRLLALSESEVLQKKSHSLLQPFVEIACILLRTPFAYISFIDVDIQHIANHVGPLPQTVERSMAICNHTILEKHALACKDLSKDMRFKQSPLVCNTPQLRGYLGIPIRSVHGLALGSLCVADKQARNFSNTDKGLLQTLAHAIENLIQLNKHQDLLVHITDLHHKLNQKNNYIKKELKAPLQSQQSRELTFANKPVHIAVGQVKLLHFPLWASQNKESKQLTFLNDYFKQMETLIRYHHGILTQFDGQGGIQFIIEAQVTEANCGLKATLCALDMQKEMKKLQEIYQNEAADSIQMSIAVANGEALATYLGMPTQNGYHYMGSVLDRVQSMSSICAGNQILLAEETKLACGDKIEIGNSIPIILPDNHTATQLHAVIGIASPKIEKQSK